VTALLAWWVMYEAPRVHWLSLDPLDPFRVSNIVQSLLESIEYHPIDTLDLSVGPRMGE
jgi:hypothetical protein